MTVTPLSSRDHRTPSPISPRPRPGVARQRRATMAGSSAEPAALTITFQITIAGESRYSEALEILDNLREVTEGLSTATLNVTRAVTPEDEDAFTDPYDAPHGEAFVATPALRAVPEQTLPNDGSIQIMPDSRIVTVAGEQISLTRMEFNLLVFLAEHPRQVFFRSQLIHCIWNYKYTGERTVDVHIRRLRVKLGDSLVTTVRGVGYRLGDKARVQIVQLH
jgi:two-component system OmpR family response regulator